MTLTFPGRRNCLSTAPQPAQPFHLVPLVHVPASVHVSFSTLFLSQGFLLSTGADFWSPPALPVNKLTLTHQWILQIIDLGLGFLVVRLKCISVSRVLNDDCLLRLPILIGWGDGHPRGWKKCWASRREGHSFYGQSRSDKWYVPVLVMGIKRASRLWVPAQTVQSA